MGIDAFIVYDLDLDPKAFAEQCLVSKDFTVELLKEIARTFRTRGLPNTKADLAQLIIARMGDYNVNAVADRVIHALTTRKREGMAIKFGRVNQFPLQRDPKELVLSPGQEKWHGPLTHNNDVPEARWYIRPVFVPHHEIDQNGIVQKRTVRWLCFGRLTRSTISLHWNGFSLTESSRNAATVDDSTRNTQFPYWNHIPNLFREIEEIAEAEVKDVSLHDLTLNKLWDEYRDIHPFEWVDRRIRAERAGVSLSAYAGRTPKDFDPETWGILNLASTLRKAVEEELITKYEIKLPTPKHFDTIILKTLIKEYGALSYQFRLSEHDKPIFHAHIYFGHKKPKTANSLQSLPSVAYESADIFPHLLLKDSELSDLEQLGFLLRHL